jgi:lysophospholipase L1-like esterase
MPYKITDLDKTEGIVPTITCWGDSLTQGTGGTPFPTYLAYAYRRLVNNFGIGGQRMAQIAQRQGATPIYLTLSGNAFSGTTAVSVTSINYSSPTNINSPISTPADNTTRYMGGTINGIQCQLTRTSTGGPPSTSETYTLKPVGTSVASIPSGSRFYPDDSFNAKNDIQVLWFGRNNVPTLTGLDTIIDNAIGVMAKPKRVIVIGVLNAIDEPNGSGNKTAIDAMNAILLANYPTNFIPITPPTQEEATAVGYGTLTGTDNTEISSGIFPTTFHTDNVHLNSFGYQVIANRVITMINSFDW